MFTNFFIHPYVLHFFLLNSIVFLTEANIMVDLLGRIDEWETPRLCWYEISASLSVWNKNLVGYRILGWGLFLLATWRCHLFPIDIYGDWWQVWWWSNWTLFCFLFLEYLLWLLLRFFFLSLTFQSCTSVSNSEF